MQSSRTFRVFVSSTFSDLKAERNALQERVFPKLREMCEQHGCRFQAIDLRWGVSEEAGFDQQTMRICLGEVERCQQLSPRPNFIVLLGDRYGWQPLLYEIPTLEYEALTQHLDPGELTFLETWYRRDENAVPPVYDLLPREGEFEVHASWRPAEKELHRILRKGIDKVALPDDARLKYYSSATEQEIYKGALDEPDAAEHVFCFFRGIPNLPQDAAAKEFIDFTEEGCLDEYAHGSLTRLKEKLHHDLPGNIHEYNDCNWTGSGITTSHIEQLCDDVYQELSDIISAELAFLQQIDSHEQEIANHAAFADERSNNFTGRTEILKQILSYVLGDFTDPLAVCGEGGSGKSALIAQVSKRIASECPDGAVVSRFIGATPSSSNIFSLLESLCRQIAEMYGTEITIPTEYKELVEEFHEVLGFATVDKPLILLLDALDQLSDTENAKKMQWLPTALPSQVKVIVSVLTPSACFDHLKTKLPEEQILPVVAMAAQEAEVLLDLWLDEANRVLQPSQRQEVLGKFRQCGLPLYLKIAFEKARNWKSYGNEEISGLNIQEIIIEFLGKLSEESRHGAVLVKYALGYLAAGKNGLTEEEMLDLLSLDDDVKEAFRKRSPNSPMTDRLPVVVWSRLYLDLRPYLTVRNADQASVMGFFHREFGEVVRSTFLDAESNRELHRRIAKYFGSQPYLYVSDGKKVPNYRKVSEIAYQMIQGEMWEELEKTITDFDFPMTKCMAGMVDELVQEYQQADMVPVPDKESMKIWAVFFRERAHILRRGNEKWPDYMILMQLAVEHADESPLTIEAEKFLENGKCDWAWLRREIRPENVQKDPCLAVFEGHSSEVDGALLLPNGQILSWADDRTLRLWCSDGEPIAEMVGNEYIINGALQMPDGRILSWFSDGTLRLWSPDGELLAILEGHSGSVEGALLMPDGQILSWADYIPRLWSSEGEPLTKLNGHTSWIEGALLMPDGRILSWASDNTLRLWSSNGEALAELKGHTDSINGALLMLDDRILSWSSDNTLRLWSSNGEVLAELKGHTDSVTGALLMNGGSILSWEEKKILRLWSAAGEPLAELKGHTGSINGALLMPDGRILSWSSDDTLRLWSSNGEALAVLEGHKGAIQSALLMPNGRILSRAYKNEELHLWSAEGEPLSVLFGHSDAVKGALLVPDGRLLSWSKDTTLRMWSTDEYQDKSAAGHSRTILGTLLMPNGQILSWSDDKTLRIWSATGEPLAVLEGHNREVLGALLMSDERILSWSYDATLRQWNSDGKPLVELEHRSSFAGKLPKRLQLKLNESVKGALLLEDGRILSRSDDDIRLWSIDGNRLAILGGHFNKIQGALQLPDSRIITWAFNRILLWTADGKPLAELNHNLEIRGVLQMPDGRILSWSHDKTLRLWSAVGEPIAVLNGHSSAVIGVLLMSNGRILSWSDDKTLRLWDTDGEPLAVLDGHNDLVRGALLTPDDRILSWARDNTLHLWSSNGEPLDVYKLDDLFALDADIWQSYVPLEHQAVDCGMVIRDKRVIIGCAAKEMSWHAKYEAEARHLHPDGRAVVTQYNELCILTTWHGNRRVTLNESPLES
jgi:WD40 repeat protein